MKRVLLTVVALLSLLVTYSCSDAKQKEVGIQLYSLRDDIAKEGIEKVIEQLSQMGYTKLELAGYKEGKVYGMEVADFIALADKHNMSITSSHVVRKLTKDIDADLAFWAQAIDDHIEMQADYIIMPAYPFKRNKPVSIDEVVAVCNYFNKVGEMANSKGIKFGYHNHAHEFTNTIDGQPLYDIMLSLLDPASTFMQLDVYWVQAGGYDPVAYIEKYSGRFPVLHIKDEKVIGASGTMDFKSIFEAAYKQGLEDYYIEVEEYETTPYEDVAKSLDFINQADYIK